MNKIIAGLTRGIEAVGLVACDVAGAVRRAIFGKWVPPEPGEPPVYADMDRLSYYRLHGLTACDDYPGGDARFESDVLSGEEHDCADRIGAEDAYIIARMDDGRFSYDARFLFHTACRSVVEAFVRNWHTNRLKYVEYTNAGRLAYYRAHGLESCDDYPGGDVQFEIDVLSGEYHDVDLVCGPSKREDAYIIERMRDGRFRFDNLFSRYGMNMEVEKAYIANASKNGFTVSTFY